MKYPLVLALVFGLGCTGDILDPGQGGQSDDSGTDSPGDPDIDAGPNDPDAEPPPPDAPPPPTARAAGVSIREVAVYQGIKVTVAENGAPVNQRVGPVVAGADSMLGIFVDVEGGFQGRQIRAVVTIDGTEVTETANISGATGDNPTQNGFTVDIPGELITIASSFSVELKEVGDGTFPGSTDGARYPSNQTASLGAQSSNGPLELVIVPFQYNADGSGRLPPLEASDIAEYERLFTSMFPVASVNLSVRQAVPYSSRISAQSGWQGWLDRLTQIRSQDGVGRNVYYYGVAAPTQSISQYCRGGCILGLGYVPGATNSSLFASVGVSFADSLSIFTALHEVGHTLGRSHSPCGGVSGADPGYPHSGGRVGVWGYDVSRDELKSPTTYTDVMGYCRDQWISDYTYNAIFDRVSRVNQNFAPRLDPTEYRVGLVDGQGAVTWTRTQVLDYPPTDNRRRISLLDRAGDSVGEVDGYFVGYDHLPGGTLFVPLKASSAARPAAIDVGGVGRMRW